MMTVVEVVRRGISMATAGLLLAAGGCGPATRGAVSPTTASKYAYPSVPVAVADGPARLHYRQFELEGSYSVASYTDRYALLVRNTGRTYPSTELWLLDLLSGRSRALRTEPVSKSLRYEMLGCRLSDGWIVWEEASPNDLEDPQHLGWRLFEAPFDVAKGLGRPVVVDESAAGRRSRPLFGVTGRTVVWMTNALTVDTTGRVRQHDGLVSESAFAGGRRTTLSTEVAAFGTLSVSEGRTVLASWEASAGTYRLLVAGGGHPSSLTTLGPETIAHFPAVHDGNVAWAVAAGGAAWPNLMLREPSGRLRLMGVDSLNPVFSGNRLFFESNESSRGVHHAVIWTAERGAAVKAVVVRTAVETDGWWHTVLAQGYSQDTLVIYNDLSPWKDGTDRRTLIRVYDAGT